MKTACPYCGNNPVPHRFYRYSENLNIFLTPLRQELLYNPLSRFFKVGEWLSGIENFLLELGLTLKAVSLSKDIKACKIRRAQVLWEEAEKRGINMRQLFLFGKPVDAYMACKKEIRNPKPETRNKSEIPNSKSETLNRKTKIIFSGLPRPVGYINRWLDLMDDKWLFKKAMMENGLPVPYGKSCSNFGQAKKVFRDIESGMRSVPIYGRTGTPINVRATAIIKPRAGSRGRHSTIFVSNEEDLKKAFKIAKQLCFWVIVEEQLFGPVYRATVINGHLAGVLRGDSPQVAGDGESSIADLIKKKNQAPHPGVKDTAADVSCEVFLSRQNLALSSVLEKGRSVNLSEKIGVNYGGSSSEDFEICHPDNKELFLRAAKVLGDPLVGFDFIIPDISASWKNQKCGFIEVNSLPFINLHHDPLHGQPRNAAALVWDMLGM